MTEKYTKVAILSMLQEELWMIFTGSLQMVWIYLVFYMKRSWRPPPKNGWKVLLSTENPPLPLSKKSCIAIFTSRDFWSITPLHCRQGWLFLCIIRGATLYGYRGRSRRDLTPPPFSRQFFSLGYSCLLWKCFIGGRVKVIVKKTVVFIEVLINCAIL